MADKVDRYSPLQPVTGFRSTALQFGPPFGGTQNTVTAHAAAKRLFNCPIGELASMPIRIRLALPHPSTT